VSKVCLDCKDLQEFLVQKELKDLKDPRVGEVIPVI
jgi:hypothetical protein